MDLFGKRIQRRVFRHAPWLLALLRWYRKICVPFMGGVPLHLVVRHFIRNIDEDSVTLRASSVAFNLFLSLFPALIFIFTLLPYIPIQNLTDEVMEFLHSLMPYNAYTVIRDTLVDILESKRGDLLSVGLLTAFYFASNGVLSLMEVYNRSDSSNILKKRLRAIVLTVVLGVLLIVAMVILVISQLLITRIIQQTILPDSLVKQAVLLLQWIIILLILFLGCIILYRHGDVRSTRWRYTYPGAVLATVLTLVTSLAYAWYVDNFSNYNKLYGSLGALIISMLWLYFNCIVLIVGHEFNRSLMQARLSQMDNSTSA